MEEINVYTTPTCPWCGKVKEYLQAKGVQYSEIDVAADASGARRLVELTGQPCDGPLFRGVPVAVAGGGNAGLQACRDLMEFASEVHLIDPDGINADQAVRERVIGSDKLHLHEHYRVRSIGGEKTVTHIKISGPDNAETDLAVQGLFVEIGLLPNSDPVGLAARNGNGEVIVDCYCRTDVPGLFAAGDVTTACGKQIIIAAGEGAKAAIAVGQFLDYG